MNSFKALEILREAQRKLGPPVTAERIIPDEGREALIALVNAVPDLIRLLGEWEDRYEDDRYDLRAS